MFISADQLWILESRPAVDERLRSAGCVVGHAKWGMLQARVDIISRSRFSLLLKGVCSAVSVRSHPTRPFSEDLHGSWVVDTTATDAEPITQTGQTRRRLQDYLDSAVVAM